MAGRANVTFSRGCPAAELPGTADGKDDVPLTDPCSRSCHTSSVAQRHSTAQRQMVLSTAQHRLLVGVVTGLAIRVSNCLY